MNLKLRNGDFDLVMDFPRFFSEDVLDRRDNMADGTNKNDYYGPTDKYKLIKPLNMLCTECIQSEYEYYKHKLQKHKILRTK